MALQIGFLVFPGIQLLDIAGPFDTFAAADGVEQHLVWKDLAPVPTTSGWALTPTATLADCPPLDVLCVPGGSGVNALLEDAAVLGFLRRQAAGVRFLTSVCSGALVLGAAGLLKGRRATTHWASHHLLERLGAIPVESRIVADGTVITGGGITAGIDLAIDLIARLKGEEEAQGVQLRLEYAPAPPFDAGTPATAPAAVTARARAAYAPVIAERERITARLQAGA